MTPPPIAGTLLPAAPAPAPAITPLPPLPLGTTQAAPATVTAAPARGFPWGWVLAGMAVAALGAGLALMVLRQRPGRFRPVAAPRIEKPALAPRVEPAAAPPPAAPAPPPPAPAPPPPAPAQPLEPLELVLHPVRLSLTLLNASLAYRLEIANRGPTALDGVRIEADMIAAHASLDRAQQLGGPNGAPSGHELARLEPGESRTVDGEFRLPFGQIVPIRQGDAALLLPLARFRAHAAGIDPIVRTFAVGQRGASGLQPFRLDLGPRIYPDLAQRAFA